MNTTSLIVEVLVGGLVTLIWLALLVFRVYGINLGDIEVFASKYKDWSSYILFITMAASYQLGWIMIHLSYLLTSAVLIEPLRHKVFSEGANHYREIKNKVYSNSSHELMDGIEKDRSVIRLTRTGLVNFFALSTVLLFYKMWCVSLMSLMVSMVCMMQLASVYRSLYKKLLDSHCEITGSAGS